MVRVKKNATLTALLLLILVTTGCARSTITSSNSSCVFPDSFRSPAPEFICNATYPGYPITQLVQSTEFDLSIRERIELATQLQIESWATQWALEWFDDSSQPIAKQWLTDYLSEDVRVLRSRTSPKGVLWLLTGLNKTLDEIEQQARLQLMPWSLVTPMLSIFSYLSLKVYYLLPLSTIYWYSFTYLYSDQYGKQGSCC